MTGPAAILALLSTAVFGGLVLMSDRPRGAFIAQITSALAAAVVFVSLVAGEWLSGLGLTPSLASALGIALLSASFAGMLYHLYLGRFTSVWRARGIFTIVFLVIAALFGTIYLALI